MTPSHPPICLIHAKVGVNWLIKTCLAFTLTLQPKSTWHKHEDKNITSHQDKFKI